MTTHPLVRFFSPDPRHEGVRPIQVWGLRLFFLLMLVFVAPFAWRVLLSHEGPWDPVRAVTFAVWATYPALALFGVLHPLRWLPLMFFTIGYKAIWLGFVAYPCGRRARCGARPPARSPARSSGCRCWRRWCRGDMRGGRMCVGRRRLPRQHLPRTPGNHRRSTAVGCGERSEPHQLRSMRGAAGTASTAIEAGRLRCIASCGLPAMARRVKTRPTRCGNSQAGLHPPRAACTSQCDATV